MKDIEFGKAIRKRRLECGLKVFQLANRIHVDPVYITQIEKHGKLPSPAVMEKISSELRDRNLFITYLKIKYPLLYEEREKLYPDLNPEMEEIFKELKKRNITPEEQKRLEKRITNFHSIFMKDKKELQKTMQILDIIEKLTLSFKKKARQEGRSKEFSQTEKAMGRINRGKF